MNILVLTHRPLYPPVYGYSRVITDTYMAVAGKGHQVSIVSIVPKKKNMRRYFDKLYYIEISEPTWVFVKLAITRFLLRLSRGELLFYHLLWLTKSYASQKIVEKTIKNIKEYLGEPDVVIAETIYPGFLAKKIAEKLNIKYIVRIHNIEAQYISNFTKLLRNKAEKTIGLLEEEILKKACKVIALSYKDYLTIQTLYNNVKTVYIPPILIPKIPEHENIIKKLGVEKNNYYLFLASPHKPNIYFLKKIIKCWTQMQKYEYKLVIGGSISPIAKKLLRRYNATKNSIVVTGTLSKENITILTKNAYTCIAPHHGHGVPIKLVEALQLGIPAITTTNALQSIQGLKNRNNIYAINDIDELCDAIEILATNKSLYECIKKGAEKLSQELNYKVLSRRFINELSSLLI